MSPLLSTIIMKEYFRLYIQSNILLVGSKVNMHSIHFCTIHAAMPPTAMGCRRCHQPCHGRGGGAVISAGPVARRLPVLLKNRSVRNYYNTQTPTACNIMSKVDLQRLFYIIYYTLKFIHTHIQFVTIVDINLIPSGMETFEL